MSMQQIISTTITTVEKFADGTTKTTIIEKPNQTAQPVSKSNNTMRILVIGGQSSGKYSLIKNYGARMATFYKHGVELYSKLVNTTCGLFVVEIYKMEYDINSANADEFDAIHSLQNYINHKLDAIIIMCEQSADKISSCAKLLRKMKSGEFAKMPIYVVGTVFGKGEPSRTEFMREFSQIMHPADIYTVREDLHSSFIIDDIMTKKYRDVKIL